MIFIDTGYLVALAIGDDQLHQRAQQWADAVDGPFVTTEFVLIEFFNSLSKARLRGQAHKFLAWALSGGEIDVVPIARDWYNAGLALHASRVDQSWSLTDCISFEVMESLNVRQALTHDHYFEQAGFHALLSREPPAA